MTLIVAIVCFTIAAAAFLYGFITEWRQTRTTKYNAMVPTLPWAVVAAIFVVFGLSWLRTGIPWWAYPLAFFGSGLVSGWAITAANAHRERSKAA